MNLGAIKRAIPLVLSITSAVGVIVTAVCVAKETPDAKEKLEDTKKEFEERGDEFTRIDCVKTVAPCFVKSLIFGGSTILCIFGAQILNAKQIAGLTASVGAICAYAKEHEDKLKELSPELADKVKKLTALEHGTQKIPDEKIPKGKVRIIDEYSGNTWIGDVEDTKDGKADVLERLRNKGYFTWGYFINTMSGGECNIDGSITGDAYGINQDYIEEVNRTCGDLSRENSGFDILIQDYGNNTYLISTNINPTLILPF